MEEKKIRKVFLDALPRFIEGRCKGKINWEDCRNIFIHFIYEDIEGDIEIIKYIKNEQAIIIKYENNEFKILISGFKKGKLGRIIGKITSEFKIDVGNCYKDDKRDLIIIDKEYRDNPYNKGKNQKWYKYKCNLCGWENGWIEESVLFMGRNLCLTL